MARTKRRRSTRRRSRVGAMSLNPKNPVIMLAAVAAGYLAGDKLFGYVDGMIPLKTTAATATTPATTAPMVSQSVVGAGIAGIGSLLLFKGKKTIVKTLAGGVLAGVGIKAILKDQGVVTGYASVPIVGRRMGGYQSVPVINGIPNALKGYTSSRTANLGAIPNTLKGYTSSRMPVMGGFSDDYGRRD